MAAASLISTSIGIILLIVMAYVLVNGTISTSEMVISAQTDMTAVHMNMIGTSMEITNITTTNTTLLYINILNSGNEPILDFDSLDVYLLYSDREPELYTYPDTGGAGPYWEKMPIFIVPDNIHPAQWDPGELLNMSVDTDISPAGIRVTTGNGVSAETIC